MGCQSTDLCTENYLSKLCLMCADCEIFFLTCPNSTLFFFAFQACRCPLPAPNQHSGRREAEGVHRPVEPDGQDQLRASRRLQAQVAKTRSESYIPNSCLSFCVVPK